MSTDLIQHAFHGQAVRVITDEHDEPWFVATDVARILGYRDAEKMTRRLDPDERGTRSVGTPGGIQSVTVITEPGLYGAVLGSQVPGARDFKRWVKHELLPEIRRTGTYSLTEDQIVHRALQITNRRVEELTAEVVELTPRAEAWDVMVSAAGDYSVDEAAKILSRDPAIEIGRNRLFSLMEELRWVYRQGARRRFHAYQSAVKAGRVVERMSAAFLNSRTGEMENPAPTIRITAKGIEALHRHLHGLAPVQIEPAPLAVAS